MSSKICTFCVFSWGSYAIECLLLRGETRASHRCDIQEEMPDMVDSAA